MLLSEVFGLRVGERARANLLSRSPFACRFTEQGHVKVIVQGRGLKDSDDVISTTSKSSEAASGTGKSPVSESEELGVKKDAYEITVRVQDTGIGIPNEKRHLIFKSFSQVVGILAKKRGFFLFLKRLAA